jgi:hypothetical protein
MENAEDLTVEYEEDGRVVIEQLDKVILSKGAWATILFKYRDWDRRKEEMGPVKYTIRRYQKRNGAFRQQAKFNISSVKQGRGLVDALSQWLAQDETP